MNKEQQELGESTMEIGQPPHSVQITYSHVITALCSCGWSNGGLEAGLVQAVAAEHLSMGAQLVTALEQRDAAVIGRKLRQQQFEDMDRLANDAITQRDAAEAQLLAKDALIASLTAEISKQNKAEDELLATGEKLAEERK